MIAGVLVDTVSRWSVLAFAAAHVLGLLTNHPVPWSATLTTAALLVVAAVATVRASTGPLHRVALLTGVAGVTAWVAVTEFRGGGLGWPFFVTESPAGTTTARLEAALLTAAVLGLSAAALLPGHGAGARLSAALRARLPWLPWLPWLPGLPGLPAGPVPGLRVERADRRAGILDLHAPAPDTSPDCGPGAGPAPGVLDLGGVGAHPGAPVAGPRRPRDGRWWRSRLAGAGTVAAAALVTAVAAGPVWHPDPYGQLPLTDSRDLTGLLLATAPLLLAALGATVAAGRSLRRSGVSRRGTALAATVLVVLAVPVVRARAGEYRFSPEPPPAQGLYIATLTGISDVPPRRPAWLPPALVHPPGAGAGSLDGLLDGSWDGTWDGSMEPPRDGAQDPSRDGERDPLQDAGLAAFALLALVALTAAALPRPTREA